MPVTPCLGNNTHTTSPCDGTVAVLVREVGGDAVDIVSVKVSVRDRCARGWGGVVNKSTGLSCRCPEETTIGCGGSGGACNFSHRLALFLLALVGCLSFRAFSPSCEAVLRFSIIAFAIYLFARMGKELIKTWGASNFRKPSWMLRTP